MDSDGMFSDVDSDIECNTDSDSNLDKDDNEYPFEVLSTEEIRQDMTNTIREVTDVIEISWTTARILLNHFKWDKEKLIEKFYDGDQENIFAEACIVNPVSKMSVETKKYSSLHLVPSIDTEAVDCGVCFAKFCKPEMINLQCGHLFCKDCWSQYLRDRIMDGREGQMITCIEFNCRFLVDDAMVKRLIVNDIKTQLRYQQHIINSFVTCNRLLRWCPAPGCIYAIKVQNVEPKAVTCKCNHTFCFYCAENFHNPVKCDLLCKWIKKCNDDSETYNWLRANTKDCPKCQVPIEKNGGCNHMTCTNINCKFHFCWSCLKNWNVHGYDKPCNVYNESKSSSTARDSLNRYLFYEDKYIIHMNSFKLESKLYGSIKRKMQEMQEQGMSWIEVQYLIKAVDVLCSCRQTLMYTYVLAYYAQKNNQKAIFEDNQNNLEAATENLSRYLERDIDEEHQKNIKQNVQDNCRYCDSRRQVLLEHASEGYEKNWWTCIE